MERRKIILFSCLGLLVISLSINKILVNEKGQKEAFLKQYILNNSMLPLDNP